MRKLLIATTASIMLTAVTSSPIAMAKSAPKTTPKKIAATVETKKVAAAPAPVTPPAPKHYIVQSGDSLSSIADANALSSWRELWNANTNITDPNMIYPDQDFVIPNAPTTERALPATVDAAPLDAASAAYNAARPAAAPATKRVVTNPNASTGDIFARIRQRESGGNYATNTGNGYYGAYQYDIRTWNNYGGYARADLAPPAVQDAKAAETYAQRGCSPWPNTCY